MLPKQRKVMSFHSLPGFQLLCIGRNLPQALFHSHQSPTDGPVPAEHPQWCSVPLHGQLNRALVGSALQNQTLVQVGSACGATCTQTPRCHCLRLEQPRLT